MHLDLPSCTRCCLCLPLRCGLIMWGYLRLVIAALMMVGAEKGFSKNLNLTKTDPDPKYIVYAVLFGFFILLTLVDIVLNIMFVIGGHRKILKFLKAYYVYSFIVFVTTAVVGLGLTSYTVYWFYLEEVDNFRVWVLLVDLATAVAQFSIQAYILLLIRSLIIKMKKSFEFRFINNAADCECTMQDDEGMQRLCDRRISQYIDEPTNDETEIIT